MILLPRLLPALLAVLIVGLATRAQTPNTTEADPLGIRRVLLSADQLAEEIKKLNQGALTRIPRNEFEKLVREATLQSRERRTAPRLIEAQYRARLTDASALVGTAQWKILHDGDGPALLRLTGDGVGFNLAVKQPRFENRDAIVTSFPDADGKNRILALWVDKPGAHTVTLEWSARTEPRPEGTFIDLRLPDCPAGQLELELPADQQLSLLDGSPVAGPQQSMAPDRRLWKIATGHKTQMTLMLRRSTASRAGVLLAWHKMTQRLSPDGLESLSSFTIESLGRDVRELTCEFDPLLRPVDVVAPGIESWDTSDPPGRLSIRLSRPLQEGVVQVRCIGPLSAQLPAERSANRPLVMPWRSPSVRLNGAIQRGETLELLLHPELRLLSWQPGDYRLTDSSVLSDLDKGISYRRLILQGGGLVSAAFNNAPQADKTKRPSPRRPGGRIQTSGVEFRAVQESWWRFNGDGMELVSQIQYELRQGQLFQMPVRLPPGWEVDAVETTPTELMRSWLVRPGKGESLLLVDLRHPLRVGTNDSAGLLLRLRRTDLPLGVDVPFPNVVPLGANYREGGLAIEFDEQIYRASVTSSLTVGEARETGPWGKQIPDHYYPFRGENLSGSLRLIPRSPTYRARIVSEVRHAHQEAILDTRLILDGESGAATYVDVQTNAPDDVPGEWRAARAASPLLRVERIWDHDVASAVAPLGASPLQAIVLSSVRFTGTTWRLWLDRSLGARQSVTLRSTRRIHEAANRRFSLPLLTLPGAARQEGEISLRSEDSDLVAIQQQGLIESPSGESQPSEPGRRNYRYTTAQPSLVVEAKPISSTRWPGATIERARLTSILGTAGELKHHFRFRVSRWPQRTLEINLPVGARVLAVALSGHWLENVEPIHDSNVLRLPVPTNEESTLYEVVYSTVTSFHSWHRLESPFPGLPVEPMIVERRWTLPPGIVPIGDAESLLLPGSALGIGPKSPGSRLLELLSLGPRLPLPGGPPDEVVESRRAVVNACAGLCGDHGGTSLPLGIVVEELVVEWLGGSRALVVDRHAIQRAGYRATTRLRIQPTLNESESLVPWDDEELTLLPFRTGVLLTTREQGAILVSESRQEDLDATLSRAAERGQDVSGRFVTALEWLGRVRTSSPTKDLFHSGQDRSGWTTWVPIAGASSGSLLVIHYQLVAVGGVVTCGVLLAILLLLRRRSPRSRFGFLLVWLAISGLGVAWLPAALTPLAWWPLLTGLAVAVPWYLHWALHQRVSTSILRLSPAVAMLSSLLLVPASQSIARDDVVAESLVFLVPDKDEPMGAVLVRPELMKRLQSLARPSITPTARAVLISATYEGKLLGDRAEFLARFQAHSFDNETATLELPLEDVQLVGDVLLDGARVLPTTLPAPRNGYALRISGSGSHKIELRFQIALSKSTDEEGTRQLRFGIPSLVQSHVTFEVPDGASYPRVVAKHGAQRLSKVGETQKLEVELGAISSPLQIRWYQEPSSAKPPKLEYREAYLWDLRLDASLLTAMIRYSISDGAVTSLLLDVPQGLEVRSAQARRAVSDKPASGESRSTTEFIRLVDWSMQQGDEMRAVKLDFAFPVSGALEVTLELAPSAPWNPSVLLPLPRPRGEPEPSTLSFLAYRQLGLQVTRTDWVRLTGIRPEQFAPFWTGSSRPSVNSLDYASSFRRDPRQPPELRLSLRPATPKLEATQTTTIRVGPARAELSSRFELIADNKDLSLVECQIDSPQPVTIANVTGADVSRWSQSGSRLLIWLERTTGITNLELSGWFPLVAPAKPGEPSRLDLPCLKLGSPSQVQCKLVVRPTAGLTLRTPVLHNLIAEKPTEAGDTVLVGKQANFGGSFVVQPGPAPNVHAVLHFRREGKAVKFDSTIDYRYPGEIRSLVVRLRGWDGDSWLESPAGTEAKRREQHRRSGGSRERTWSLDLAPGVVGKYRARLYGELPLDESTGSIDVPEIVVPGANVRQLVQLEDGLLVEGALGLLQTSLNGKPAWQVQEDGWSLRILPRPRTISAPESVLLTELRSSILDGRRWTHEARFWVRHESPAELRVRMPADVESARLVVDGAAQGLLEGSEIKFPLSGTSGLREVILTYNYPFGSEALDEPRLIPPQILGTSSGPLLWTVDVPAGWEVSSSKGGTRLGAGSTRRAVVELHRASVAAELIRELSGSQRTAESTLARERFSRCLALARLALKSGAEGQRPLGPDSVDLFTWLTQLEGQLGEIDDASLVEPVPRAEEFSRTGTAYAWRQDRSDSVPSVTLAPAAQEQTRQAIGFSGQWLFALLAAWTITLSRVLHLSVRLLWPECAAILGLFGWYLVGPTAPVLLAVLLGILGRLYQIADHLRTAWQQLRANPSSRSSSSPLAPR